MSEIFIGEAAGVVVGSILVYCGGRPMLNPTRNRADLTKWSRHTPMEKLVSILLGMGIGLVIVMVLLQPTTGHAGMFSGLVAVRWAHVGDIDTIVNEAGEMRETAKNFSRGKNNNKSERKPK